MDQGEPISIEQQAAIPSGTGAVQPVEQADGTLVFNILRKRSCVPAGDAGEIVVCAPDPDEHRIPELEPPESQEFRPELTLVPNVKAALRGETDKLTRAQRVWVDLRFKF